MLSHCRSLVGTNRVVKAVGISSSHARGLPGAWSSRSRAVSSTSSQLRFDGRCAIVTGAGGGLGRHYALDLAGRGAAVVVNDLSADAVNATVQEITNAGGKAVGVAGSVAETGKALVDQAVASFGHVDVLINNAGILRDRSFHKMSKEEWQSVIDVHLQGTFEVCYAAWPLMRERGYGRIVNVTSGAGLFGNFGQANYGAAKMGIVGLTKALAAEGAAAGITANCIAPIAASQMTSSLLPAEYLELLAPGHVTAMVSYLAHESTSGVNGQIFEVGGGWYALIRWERTAGATLGTKGKEARAEDVAANFQAICDFRNDAAHPTTLSDSLRAMMASSLKAKKGGGGAPEDIKFQPQKK